MRPWKRRLAVVAVLLAVRAVHVAACVTASNDDGEARLRYLARRLDAGELDGVAPGAPFDGEWRLITLSNTVVAATNLAVRDPSTRELHAAQVERWTRLMLTERVRGYDTVQWRGGDPLATLDEDEAHVGYLGHVLLAQGAACLLGRPVEPKLHDRLAHALARRLERAPGMLVESYPGEIYVPDNALAAAGLALRDRCTGKMEYRPVLARWVATMRAQRRDADTGVLVFAPGQAGRGSGAAWSTAYLGFVDEAFAREQAEALRTHFAEDVALGASGIREWPRGVEGGGGVDSGPLVLGLSMSATGYGLAAPALVGDEAWLRSMLVSAETVGFTIGLSERRYLFAPLVGDAIVLAGKTTTPWPAGPMAAVAAR